MKLVYDRMGHILNFDKEHVIELVVENKRLFFDMVNDMTRQIDGEKGGFVLSIGDKLVEISRYADLSLQFAPFQVNRKSLLTKLCSALEQEAMSAENFMDIGRLLAEVEQQIIRLADDLPFDVSCKKLSIGSIIKAIAPEIDHSRDSALDKIFAYMQLVREIDHDRLFVLVNMRTYFSDDDMDLFAKTTSLHDFKVLLLESTAFAPVKYSKRYIIDDDLCEF